jgi:hypothetical protein
MTPFVDPSKPFGYLTNQLNNAACFLELLFCFSGEESSAHDKWYFWETAFTEDFGVPEREEVENRCGVGLLVGKILFALLDWHKGPQLVEIDHRFPEVITLFVEVTHADLSEVTRTGLVLETQSYFIIWFVNLLVFVHVGAVMMLTTSKTTSTRMLSAT